MKQNFMNSVKMTRPNRNVFDLSHDLKLSMNMGQLVPVFVQDCVPGDKFVIGCDTLVRFAPMLAPVMHRMDVTVHYFFVANRLLWPEWEDFITGGEEGSIPPVHPYVEYTKADYDSMKLLDYFGLPDIPAGVTVRVNPFPLAGYQRIYNEYYRDQNLSNEEPDELESGLNVLGDFTVMQARAWMHDYFTAALPWAQKGAAVDIPLGNISPQEVVLNDPGGVDLVSWNSTATPGGATQPVTIRATDYPDAPVGDGALMTTPSSVEPTTINDLRKAFKLQEWLEKNARGGTRYTESNLVHFGVRSSDARLQRPEYITGVKTPVIISEVLNTTGEVAAGGLPQGNMAGHGIAVAQGKYGSYYAEEHGYIIGIMSVLPLPAYQQGIPRHFLRSDRFDYYWPSFAHIGEQPVLNKELYVGDDGQNDEVFGYMVRYAEYRYNPNRVAGQFKTTLNYWHLGRIFDERPLLNHDFVVCDPSHRIFAVTDPSEDKLYCHVLNKVKGIRPIPKFGTPSF